MIRPRGRAQPLPPLAREQAPALERESPHVQLGMEAIDARGPLRHEGRAMPQEGGPLAVIRGRGIDLRDQPRHPHARE